MTAYVVWIESTCPSCEERIHEYAYVRFVRSMDEAAEEALRITDRRKVMGVRPQRQDS